MEIRLISIDRRKNLAVYEQNGVRRVIEVKFDRAGNPILDSKTRTRLQKLFDDATERELPDTPFVRAISVTTIIIT